MNEFELTEEIGSDWGTCFLDDVLAHCRAEAAAPASEAEFSGGQVPGTEMAVSGAL